MKYSLAHRSQFQVPVLSSVLVVILLGTSTVRSWAQDFPWTLGRPWGYVPDPESAAPAPSASLVPGRGVVLQASEGWSVDTGVGISYDDNQFQTPENEFAGGILTGDISLRYARGDRQARGVFFGGNFDLAYFDYLKEPIIGDRSRDGEEPLPGAETPLGQEILSEADGRSIRDGQDPFELAYGIYVGVKGVKTTVRLSGSFAQDNGNSTDQQRQDGEGLRRSSDNYSVSLNATRQLARGTLNASVSLRSIEYSDRVEEAVESLTGEPQVPVGGLTDQSSWTGNVGWSHQPQATPKTAFNLGVSFGQSEQDGGTEDSNINPSVGVNYRYSPKTSFYGNVGVDFRRSETTTTRQVPVESPTEPAPAPVPEDPTAPAPVVVPPPTMTVTETNSFDSANPTFNFGASWSPNSTTSFGVSVGQRSDSSSIRGQSSYDTRSVTFTATKQFPRGYFASLNYSLEDSSYTNNAGVEDSSPGRLGTPEDYSRFGFTIGRGIQLRPNVSLNMSAYYQRNVGSGDDVLSEFEQNVTGIRLGLTF